MEAGGVPYEVYTRYTNQLLAALDSGENGDRQAMTAPDNLLPTANKPPPHSQEARCQAPQANAGTAASRTVRSRDGTTISYRTVGHGPAVIVIPIAMSTADDYAAFADAFGETFTVHTIERRGRS